MHTRFKQRLGRRSRAQRLVFLAIFCGVGVAVLAYSRAATPTAHFEVENTSRTAATTNSSDTTASSGAYLEFGRGAISDGEITIPDSSGPTTYMTDSELDAVRSRVQANQQPWKAAYDRLISKANGELGQANRSVVTNGGGHTLNDPWAGEGRPQVDYAAAREMNEAIYNLALAYRLSGNNQYGSKALSLINHWALNDSTYMSPNMAATNSERLLAIITMPGIVYGADLIWGYSGWTSAQRTEFEAWVKLLGESARTTPADDFVYRPGHEHYHIFPGERGSKQNKEAWRLNLVAVCGGFLRRTDLLKYAVDTYKNLMPKWVGAPGTSLEGIMLLEYNRPAENGLNGGLAYSNYAMNAMTYVSQVAMVHGQDLFNYRTPQGASLKLALDKMITFNMDPTKWTYSSTKGMNDAAGRLAFYEYAYKNVNNPAYLTLINKWGGRPAISIYGMLGNLTVTHAR